MELGRVAETAAAMPESLGVLDDGSGVSYTYRDMSCESQLEPPSWQRNPPILSRCPLVILKSLRDPPTPVDSPPLTNCMVPQVWGQEKHVFLPRSFFMSQMLRMLEMQGMQPHNLQEQSQSSHSRF